MCLNTRTQLFKHYKTWLKGGNTLCCGYVYVRMYVCVCVAITIKAVYIYLGIYSIKVFMKILGSYCSGYLKKPKRLTSLHTYIRLYEACMP